MTEQPAAGALYRFRDQTQGVADAGGVATLEFLPPGGQYWLIERMAVRTGDDTGDAAVYVGAVADQNLSDYTPSVPAIADENSPIFVPSHSTLLVQFTGVTAGVSASVSIQGLAYPA